VIGAPLRGIIVVSVIPRRYIISRRRRSAAGRANGGGCDVAQWSGVGEEKADDGLRMQSVMMASSQERETHGPILLNNMAPPPPPPPPPPPTACVLSPPRERAAECQRSSRNYRRPKTITVSRGLIVTRPNGSQESPSLQHHTIRTNLSVRNLFLREESSWQR
jgi:hypothetical protein